jgi:Tol biopolymer transport system component
MLRAGETTRVSVSSSGAQGDDDSSALSVSMSADARFVAFSSIASNLVPGDTNGRSDVFVHDRSFRVTYRVIANSNGVQGGSHSRSPSISADGRFVAFQSQSSNLAGSSTPLGTWNIYVHDQSTGATSCVSVDSAGLPGSAQSLAPSISADGRFVAFESDAPTLVPGDTNAARDVFVHDRATGITTRASVDSAGRQASGSSGEAAISADGRFVAFTSASPNLVEGDTNRYGDVFLHDRTTRETVRVSVGSQGVQGNNRSFAPALSADARFAAFASLASNLVAGDTNGSNDVFVHDRETGVTVRVSADSAGAQANGGNGTPSISADGRFVAFDSLAWNLVPDDTNGSNDVFVHDRETGETLRASVSTARIEGNGASRFCSISPDGTAVAFGSAASNLVPGDTNNVADVFVRTLAARVRRVSPSIGSEAGNDPVTIDGANFSNLVEPVVLFGESAASVLEVAPSRIRVRTPAGTGVVSVTVQDVCGAATLEATYTYVAPELAARYGNVNAGRGDREDVLLVNASAGDPLARELRVATGQPIVSVMTAPSTLSQARFALYAWLRAPNASTLTPLPRDLGAMVIAPPFLGRTPPVVWNNLGYRRVLGAPTLPSRPAPAIVFRSEGSARPITFTLQGFIEDGGSPIPEGISVTNAVIARIE